jgi:beta-phosphoglucomutase
MVALKGEKLQALLTGGDVLFPGAAAFVRAAASAVPIAIASGALRHEILQIVDGAGLGELFATIVSSGDTPESKPSPAPYLLAFEQLQQASGRRFDPTRCVAIEDSIWGLESARGAGLRCVGVTTSYAAAELTVAELIVDSLEALTIEALDRLCGKTSSSR